jgi:hypothetical protein
VAHGFYQLNPRLRLRRVQGDETTWVPVLAALNLALARETALPRFWPNIEQLLAEGGTPVDSPPLGAPSLAALAQPGIRDWANPLLFGALLPAEFAPR